jgi:hypothetical protein
VTYRVDNHQPQNVYRDDAYIGVMFTAEDAALVVEALNGRAPGSRCPSCDHSMSMHSQGVCWFAVKTGRIDANLVCPCALRGPVCRGPWPCIGINACDRTDCDRPRNEARP